MERQFEEEKEYSWKTGVRQRQPSMKSQSSVQKENAAQKQKQNGGQQQSAPLP
jgi:hypothetical protein